MGFASPVGVPILENKAPWPGPPTFRVTSTFAQHVASGRGPGIDIGNQRCGAPVLAMAAGTVTFAGQLPTAIGMANVVRYRISGTEELGAAHLATMTVALGQAVSKGQQIGTLGMTGATACHLHQGYKVNGVEQDWWPLYTEQGDDMDASFEPVPNRTVTVNAGSRHRLTPDLTPTNIAIASDPGGPLGFPLMGTVVGEAVGGNAIWLAYWRPEVDKVYYLHSSVCGAPTAWETVAGGDCGPAIAAATAPLEKQIVTLSATVKAQSDKIGDAKAALG
jgi:hypothetical protein